MINSEKPYPAQTGEYIVKVKSSSNWQHYDTARLEISVGQSYHEEEKFVATVDWARPRFKRVIICVNDTLQRHNYRFDKNLSEDQALDEARQAGREWLDRNARMISTLPRVEVYRWEYWRKTQKSAFEEAHEKTLRLYVDNAEFRAAIDKNIKAFWDRRINRTGLSDEYRFDEYREMSKAYLLEETAAFSLIFRQDRAIDIYPGSFLEIWQMFQERPIPGAPEGLERGAFARIDFNRNKNFQPWAPPVLGVAMAATL